MEEIHGLLEEVWELVDPADAIAASELNRADIALATAAFEGRRTELATLNGARYFGKSPSDVIRELADIQRDSIAVRERHNSLLKSLKDIRHANASRKIVKDLDGGLQHVIIVGGPYEKILTGGDSRKALDQWAATNNFVATRGHVLAKWKRSFAWIGGEVPVRDKGDIHVFFPENLSVYNEAGEVLELDPIECEVEYVRCVSSLARKSTQNKQTVRIPVWILAKGP